LQAYRHVFSFSLSLSSNFISSISTLFLLTLTNSGGGAFLGLAGYSYITGQQQLELQKAKIMASKSMFGMRSRSMGITGISLGLAWLGFWRLFK